MSSSPLPTEQQIESHYRRKFESGNYNIARRYEAEYRQVHAQLAVWVAPHPGDRILDIGCFTGELLVVLQERGADVYGLELQKEAAAIASERLPGRIFEADVHGRSFPQASYEIITMMGLIEHVLDPLAMLDRARQLLKPGGRIYLQTPDAGCFTARALGCAWPPLAPVEHIHLFSRKSLTRLLGRTGFTNVRIRRHIKRLPVAYVHEQLAHFGGPAWQTAFAPFRKVLGNRSLPFYGGEMLVAAELERRN